MTEAESTQRGAFVLFEGIDRCGKSSQTKMLVENLKAKGVNAELWCYPDRTTEIGKMINAYLCNQSELSDQAIHLLFAANRWEKSALMEKKLKEGTTLVVDRYSFSGVAFTSAKEKQGIDLDWCKAPERGLIAPDCVMYLKISVEDAAKRGGFGEERYEKLDFQKKVTSKFEDLRDDSWHIVDATQSMEAVQEQVQVKAMEIIEKCQSGAPLTRFQ
eukprot:CAMPEP_0118941682 /NCGR_PEP_ID=MMETSP1169-20130426/34430_1 /TAXON_ID=36882 /ORGANISM="Pyramimonas obovata, Strain CCMP722" /LENGTH=215 /DNA_ID=CAMNT_0006886511 /DNA_START=244 /DNA_END=891 /DNA_ORIENTATION=-